jgi:hypothetical protein
VNHIIVREADLHGHKVSFPIRILINVIQANRLSLDRQTMLHIVIGHIEQNNQHDFSTGSISDAEKMSVLDVNNCLIYILPRNGLQLPEYPSAFTREKAEKNNILCANKPLYDQRKSLQFNT